MDNMDYGLEPLDQDELLDLVTKLVMQNQKLEKELREVRGRLDDAECAVSAFINALPDAMQIDPRLN